MLSVNDVSKYYGKKAILKNISFEATAGETVGILGRNGSGKSTLLSIISSLSAPSEGSVTYLGKKVAHNANKIGYATQENCLFEELTVKDNISYWKSAYKVKTIPQDFLGMKGMENKLVKNLSGGMKRRLSIWLALLHNPSCILLDEPCNALDIIYKDELIQYLKNLENKIILIASHDLYEISELCSRVLIIDSGTIVNVCKGDLTHLKSKYIESVMTKHNRSPINK